MTWATFKTFVKEKMDGDGVSAVVTDVTALSTFDLRCQIYFKKYTRETYQVFYASQSLTWISNNDQFVFLGGAAANGTAPVIFEPTRVWLNTTEINEITMEQMDALYPKSGTAASASPGYWAKWREKYIWFNTPLSAAVVTAGVKVAGWGEQPNFTTAGGDSDVLIIPDEEADLAAEYVAHHFIKPVASDMIGAQRLAMYMENSQRAIAEVRSRNLARFNRALRKGLGKDAL